MNMTMSPHYTDEQLKDLIQGPPDIEWRYAQYYLQSYRAAQIELIVT